MSNQTKQQQQYEEFMRNLREATCARLVKQHMPQFETLETRKSDSLDFHDVAVWQVKALVEAAFEAGRNSVR